MELFYRVYDELQKLSSQKNDFERKIQALQDEQNDLVRKQKLIQKALSETRGELNDQHAFNEQIGSENMERELGISESKRKSENVYD